MFSGNPKKVSDNNQGKKIQEFFLIISILLFYLKWFDFTVAFFSFLNSKM